MKKIGKKVNQNIISSGMQRKTKKHTNLTSKTFINNKKTKNNKQKSTTITNPSLSIKDTYFLHVSSITKYILSCLPIWS